MLTQEQRRDVLVALRRRKLRERLGFKPYWFRCPRRFGHLWRPVYGDEIHQVGARWACRECPATHPGPVAEKPPA